MAIQKRFCRNKMRATYDTLGKLLFKAEEVYGTGVSLLTGGVKIQKNT